MLDPFTTQITVPGKNQGQLGHGNPVFRIKSVHDVVTNPQNLIPVKHVFGDYAFENEITFIGGTTNTGKSIFAMDIAIAVAAHTNHWGQNFACDIVGKVVLIDTELSDVQFARRYPNPQDSDNLFRASFWTDAYGITSIKEILDAIEELFMYGEPPKVIILDNLSTVVSLTSAKESQDFIQGLKKIKDTYACSLIIVTHTNKRNITRPIEMDDFRGSKMIMNLADQVVALGNTLESKDFKYVKILKSRNIRIPEEVSLLRISDEGYLHFEYEGTEQELDILPKGNKRGPSSTITTLQAERILEMNAQGVSIRGIAQIMGISKSTVGRFLKSERPDEML